jgi:hypothetical protein
VDLVASEQLGARRIPVAKEGVRQPEVTDLVAEN